VLQYQNTPCTTHEAKAEVLHSYYSKQFGQAEQRDCTLAWQNMQLPRHDLTSLDADINEEEVHTTIKQMPAEKGVGPDGYIGAFYKIYWDIIKDDLIAAVHQNF
jgi:hypothetical protein